MKIRTETVPDGDEEIVIRCTERTDKIILLESLIENALNYFDPPFFTETPLFEVKTQLCHKQTL